MSDLKKNIPEHLKELDCSSPSSWRKLIAAWDGLNVQTQIIFLNHVKQDNPYPSPASRELHEQAFDSQSAYIRYLAAKWLINNDAEEEILEKIKNDSSPLVRYCQYEVYEKWVKRKDKDIKLFWSLPHEGRLAFIRRNTKRDSDFLFEIVKESVKELAKIDAEKETTKITYEELDEILSDFVCQEGLQEYYYNQNRLICDGSHDYSISRDLEKLWQIATLLPNGIGEKYVEKLPVQSDMFFELTKDIANQLNYSNLQTLLYRKDVYIEDFRKELFFDKTKSYSIKWAAVSYNFDLNVDEFVIFIQYLKESKKNNEELEFSLSDLGNAAENLSLWLYQAIIDEIENIEDDDFEWSYCPWVRFNLKQRLGDLKNESPSWYEYHVRNLRLYLLASRVFEDDDYFSNDTEMAFLEKHIVYKDKWATFSNFVEVWSSENKLDKYLPSHELIANENLDLMENSSSKGNPEHGHVEATLISLSQQLEKHSRYFIGIIVLLVFLLFIK